MNKIKIPLPLILLVVSAVAVWFIFENKPVAKKFAGAPKHKLRTEVMKPEAVSYEVWVPSYGIIKPKTQSLVVAQVAGQIMTVSDQFRDGAFFEKGDVLLEIDDADYQAQLTIAQAELKQAEYTYQDEVAQAEQALKDWKKLGNKNEPPALVARTPQLRSSLSNLEASRAKVAQAELNLKRTKIIAPFAGRVLSLDVNVGQVVNSGSTLGSIYAVDSVEVRLPLKQSDLVHLELPETYRDLDLKGMMNAAQVKLSAQVANKTHSWEGKLVRVEGTIDEETRQLYVVVEVEDPYKFREDGTPPLKIGQFVNAKIKGNVLKDVVVLPRSAVYSSNYINVIEDGVLERKYITPLWEDDADVLISNEFNSNQLISLTPLGDVVSGTAVEIITEELSSKQLKKPLKKNKQTQKAGKTQ